MALRFARWISLLALGAFALLLYAPGWQQWLAETGFIPDQYRFGDLYNMTYLPQFRETDYPRNANVPERERPRQRVDRIDLLVIGDSFTGIGIDTGQYAGHRTVHRWIDGSPAPTVRLDSTRRTILVLEIVERILFERVTYTPEQFIRDGIRIDTARPEPVSPAVQSLESSSFRPTLWSRVAARIPRLAWFSAEAINQRIEFLVFNFDPFRWWKECKAAVHFFLFDRILAGATASADGRRIYYGFESDPRRVEASVYPAPDTLIDRTVQSLNRIRTAYRGLGVSEVYLSLVPNKFTSLEPADPRLSHRIERIERHPDLQLPRFNITRALRSRADLYHLGDGHWNRHAKRIWLDSVNAVLAREDARKSVSAP